MRRGTVRTVDGNKWNLVGWSFHTWYDTISLRRRRCLCQRDGGLHSSSYNIFPFPYRKSQFGHFLNHMKSKNFQPANNCFYRMFESSKYTKKKKKIYIQHWLKWCSELMIVYRICVAVSFRMIIFFVLVLLCLASFASFIAVWALKLH